MVCVESIPKMRRSGSAPGRKEHAMKQQSKKTLPVTSRNIGAALEADFVAAIACIRRGLALYFSDGPPSIVLGNRRHAAWTLLLDELEYIIQGELIEVAEHPAPPQSARAKAARVRTPKKS
jgi:hypothetical protein